MAQHEEEQPPPKRSIPSDLSDHSFLLTSRFQPHICHPRLMSPGGTDGPPSRSTGTSAGLMRIWTLMTTGLYALLTVWRLAIGKINKALLFLDYGLRRRTDFFHKVGTTVLGPPRFTHLTDSSILLPTDPPTQKQ